jgi:hypothetical protein
MVEEAKSIPCFVIPNLLFVALLLYFASVSYMGIRDDQNEMTFDISTNLRNNPIIDIHATPFRFCPFGYE